MKKILLKYSFHFRSFVIPISDGKEDRHITSTISSKQRRSYQTDE